MPTPAASTRKTAEQTPAKLTMFPDTRFEINLTGVRMHVTACTHRIAVFLDKYDLPAKEAMNVFKVTLSVLVREDGKKRTVKHTFTHYAPYAGRMYLTLEEALEAVMSVFNSVADVELYGIEYPEYLPARITLQRRGMKEDLIHRHCLKDYRAALRSKKSLDRMFPGVCPEELIGRLDRFIMREFTSGI